MIEIEDAGTGGDNIKKSRTKVETVAQAYLELLSLRGVDYFFANAGTDFASIIDAFACRQAQGKLSPRPIAIPHEIPLVAMAHGYYLVTGRPQVAMVHVGVGTANAVGGLISAQRGRVPILFTAGRTPMTEDGSPVFRFPFIHWGQDCFDQAGMVREYVKWEYELKNPSQLEMVVDRALVTCLTEPRGPVYLMLPPEVMISPLREAEFCSRLRYDLPSFHPDPAKVSKAAELLARADFPLVITSSVGRDPECVQKLIDLAEAGAIGVISFNPEYMNFPPDHPCHQGFSPDAHLRKADVVLVIDCDVPWYPKMTKPLETAVVIQAGIDPLHSTYPIRGFPSDVTLEGDNELILSEITKALTSHPDRDDASIRARLSILREMHDAMVEGWDEVAQKAAVHAPLDFEWVSYNVGKVLGEDTVVVNEYSMSPQWNKNSGRYFCSSHGGYLGWGLGSALGIKLASVDKTVIATVGDGSYMFSVPSVCHFVSNANELPILVIVYNNQCWNAVKMATRGLHPEGWAVGTSRFPLSELQPTSNYEKICEAFGGYGERVETPDQVGPALERALRVVRQEKRQALLNMVCKHP
ncbi:MAG: thiamine pyrophosphate-requiring protein [Thermodesulfobacteriota bacterium]|nr:thiamine pyrophosphate-requiring protein [Thermodesulfobacteriota bacterium]